MRFFKYLVLFFSSICSFSVVAATVFYNTAEGINKTYPTSNQACIGYFTVAPPPNYKSSNGDVGQGRCGFTRIDGSVGSTTAVLQSFNQCPSSGTLLVVWLEYQTTHVPTRVCKDGCTAEGSGRRTDMNDYSNTIMQYTGNGTNCTNQYTDDPPPPCDKTDPYGQCYVPPDDNCMRASDGSIYCPDNEAPPQNETCNGADYCNRPPEGCGEGYVSGSFNGQQLCVRSGPNNPSNPPEPDQPDDPNNCMNGGSYCPQSPNNSTCPSGYYETTYNGSKICVRNNPNPDQPNPNDPNNSDGGDNGGGDGDGNGDGETGGTGETGSIDFKPILDAIKSLKDSLLAAISGISTKLSTLIDGQKTANGHLEKIEEATIATSEAISETNNKLDRVFSDEGKEQIDALGEPSNDPRFTAAESEATSALQSLANKLSYSSSHACVSDITINSIPLYGSFTVPISKYCDLLALLKLFLKLSVLMLALRMIDATVRAF
ncbi:hypothetical protein [Acinetobacter venetianus]|uniref:hypothetical protein n=1 Tax=Acinetobacter venetianus TaxID=52133 RepID=UPI0007784661|nr:hypothetical protein [Acinetobacter venetianus]KXZ64710.1 hypothetical protein AVENLUH7437_01824 [Acinetobacter venetianus]